MASDGGKNRGRRSADDLLAAAVAAGKTLAAAAADANVSERTAQRRSVEPAFRHRVQQLRSQMMATASGRLADAATEATERLRQLVRSSDERVALGAARAVLEFSQSFSQTVDLASEVEELRRLLSEGDTGDGDRDHDRDPEEAPSGDPPEEETPPPAEQPLGPGPAEVRPLFGADPGGSVA